MGYGIINPTKKFQSAPLTDVRGDRYLKIPRHNVVQFQSAPLTDVRGDLV